VICLLHTRAAAVAELVVQLEIRVTPTLLLSTLGVLTGFIVVLLPTCLLVQTV